MRFLSFLTEPWFVIPWYVVGVVGAVAIEIAKRPASLISAFVDLQAELPMHLDTRP